MAIRTEPDGLHRYFVHSYQLAANNPGYVIAMTDYGRPVTAACGTMATRRHPVPPGKSQTLGLGVDLEFPQMESPDYPMFPAIELKDGSAWGSSWAKWTLPRFLQ